MKEEVPGNLKMLLNALKKLILEMAMLNIFKEKNKTYIIYEV